MNAGSPHAPRDQPEKERERERERERKKEREKKKHGVTKLLRGPNSFIFKRYLYTFLYIEENERCKVIQSQPKHSSSFALIETRIFLHTFPTNDVVYVIFWPWRPVNIL